MKRIGVLLMVSLLFICSIPVHAKESSVWSERKLPKELSNAFYKNAILQLSNSKVLFIGSKGKKSYLYDPETNNLTKLPGVNQEGGIEQPLELSDGRIMVFTEADSYSKPIRRAEIFNFATNKWTTTGLMKEVRQQMSYRSLSATLLSDGRVLVSGGTINNRYDRASTSLELYDPASNTWSYAKAKMSLEPVYKSHGVLLQDGKVLYSISNSMGSFYQIYDPVEDSMSQLSVIPIKKYAYHRYLNVAFSLHKGVLLDDGNVLIVTDSGLYLYNPLTNEWTNVGYIPYDKDRFGTEYYEYAKLKNNKILIYALGVTQEEEEDQEYKGSYSSVNKIKQSRTMIFDPTAKSIDYITAPPNQIQPLFFQLKGGKVLALGSHKYESKGLAISWNLDKMALLDVQAAENQAKKVSLEYRNAIEALLESFK